MHSNTRHFTRLEMMTKMILFFIKKIYLVHWSLRLKIKHTCLYTYTHLPPPEKRSIKYITFIMSSIFSSVTLKLISFIVFVSLIIPPFYYCFLYLKGSWIYLRLYCGLCLQSVHLQEGKPEEGGERRSAAKIWVLSAAAFATAGGAHNTQGESPSTTSQKRS